MRLQKPNLNSNFSTEEIKTYLFRLVEQIERELDTANLKIKKMEEKMKNQGGVK